MPRLARLVAQGVALLLLLLGLLVWPIIFFSALNTFMLLGTSWNGGVFVANG
jgi:biopolymer transport protein ExbB/TolQ